MKALTIWQPWASLIFAGAKPFEFRGWDYRQRYHGIEGTRIVVHAGSRKTPAEEIDDLLDRLEHEPEETGLDPAKAIPILRDHINLPLSCGVCSVIIGKPKPVAEIFSGVIDSDRLDHTKFGWPVSAILPLPDEQRGRIRGHQGFWNWPFQEARVA